MKYLMLDRQDLKDAAEWSVWPALLLTTSQTAESLAGLPIYWPAMLIFALLVFWIRSSRPDVILFVIGMLLVLEPWWMDKAMTDQFQLMLGVSTILGTIASIFRQIRE